MLRQFSTVSLTVCVPLEPYDSVSWRLLISPQDASFSTWSQSPSVYLYSICVPSRPLSVIVQCVGSTRVSTVAPGSHCGSPPSSLSSVPAMWTLRPVTSVVAGTVTVNVTVTALRAAAAETGADGGDRLSDVST